LELTQLQALIDLLRANGVTKYATAALSLELGPPPATPAKIDLTREGFTASASSINPALKNALDRLDPSYSDPALFMIR
jgi:hypothetical protein